MTEYWVSQGNKWCDFCKIFLSNNPATIRNHELGQRHKENVAQRLTDMRKEKAEKEKKEKDAARALEQIEAKANKSYRKDVASFQQAGQARAPCADGKDGGRDWEYDSSSGYYYDRHTGIHYDPNSGFYYSDILGKWVTQGEAFAAAKSSGSSKQKEPLKKPLATSGAGLIKGSAAPGPVVSASLNPIRSVKGATSSVAVQKRKRPEDKKPKAVSAEEAAALKAREAARRRVEEREKSLLGLYRH